MRRSGGGGGADTSLGAATAAAAAAATVGGAVVGGTAAMCASARGATALSSRGGAHVALGRQLSAQAKVRQRHVTVVMHEHVAGLDVAVKDAQPVKHLESEYKLGGDPTHLDQG